MLDVDKGIIYCFITLMMAGVISISIGWQTTTTYQRYGAFLSDGFFKLIPFYRIVIGISMVQMTVIGYCMVSKGWRSFFMIFSGIISAVLIMELMAGFYAYTSNNNAITSIEKRLRDTMTRYAPPNEYVSRQWDLLQRDLSCCGVDGPADWQAFSGGFSLPMSCCRIPDGQVDLFVCRNVTGVVLETEGCLQKLLCHIEPFSSIIIAGMNIVSLLVVTGLIFTTYFTLKANLEDVEELDTKTPTVEE